MWGISQFGASHNVGHVTIIIIIFYYSLYTFYKATRNPTISHVHTWSQNLTTHLYHLYYLCNEM